MLQLIMLVLETVCVCSSSCRVNNYVGLTLEEAEEMILPCLFFHLFRNTLCCVHRHHILTDRQL